MRILITGSSGMLGQDLCEVLGEEHEVIGVDIVESKTQDPRPKTFYKGSITDSDRIAEIFNEAKPELVIHAAAWTDVDGCEDDPEKAYDINVSGTEKIIRAASKVDVPVIFISTDYVFDGEKGEPYTETDGTRQISVYGRTKREAEEAVARTLSRYIIVRTSWLYGANGKNFADTVIKKAEAGEDLRVVNDQSGSPTFTKDLAGAILRLIGKKGYLGEEIIHVTNTGWCSWFLFAEEVIKAAGKDVKIVPVTTEEYPRLAKRPRFSPLDNSKFEKTTGMKMRSWKEALKDYLKERAKG